MHLARTSLNTGDALSTDLTKYRGCTQALLVAHQLFCFRYCVFIWFVCLLYLVPSINGLSILHCPFWYFYEKFEDAKAVIRSRKPKKGRQLNDIEKDKKTNNDLQIITQKTKDQVTRTPLKTRSELRCSGRVSSSCSTCVTRLVSLINTVYLKMANN